MSVKDNIVKKLGGQHIVASICNITQAAVSQWGDLIPSRHQQKLIADAPKYGAVLNPDDFFSNNSQEIKQKSAPNKTKKSNRQEKSIKKS